MHSPIERVDRRGFLQFFASAAGLTAIGCTGLATELSSSRDGRLSARVATPTKTIGAGVHALRLAWDRDGFMYVPASYRSDKPAPLLMLLHGAAHSASEWAVDSLYQAADDFGLILVAPDSRAATWDIVGEGVFGGDLEFIDKALRRAFDHCNIDPARVALGGFSDGASCALSLGLPNGDLFSTVIAFSPGFLREPSRTGKPRIFITHGNRDVVLPISGSRSIVAELTAAGYDVTFREFSGPHAVSLTLARQAFQAVASGSIPAS
jgi:phospholipase/carboxylesterase